MPLTDDEIRALRNGCEGVTPGPWKWEGSIYDRMAAGIRSLSEDKGLAQVWQTKNAVLDAAHIARCDPTTIAELCTRLLSAEARVKVLEEAGSALIADVKRRHPGEELRCQYMRALDAAVDGE
jgi:hypothetical protein